MNRDKKKQKSKKYKIDQQKKITKSKFKLLKISRNTNEEQKENKMPNIRNEKNIYNF